MYIIMYYYPFYLHLLNLWSFTFYNNIDNHNANKKSVDLWSISRWSYARYKGTKTWTASYNYHTHIYEFDGKRYLSYEDVVNDALKL